MTEQVYEVLRSAVTMAKERQVRSVETLKAMLNSSYPNRQEDVNSAIQYWANQAQAQTDFQSN